MKLKINTYIINSLWLMVDKFYLLVGGFIVTTLVARYLGPEQLGKLSYGLVLSLFCTTLSQWGANYTIFNTSVHDAGKSASLITSTLTTRILIYLFTWIIISAYLFCTLNKNDFIIISLVCLSNMFLGLDIYNYHFNGTLQSKVNAKASILAKSLTMLMRVTFVFMGLSLVWFITPFLIEGLIILYLKSKVLKKQEEPVYDLAISKQYFKYGLVFLSSSILTLIYSQANVLILRGFSSFKEVGVYTAGLTIAGAWTFIPTAIGISYLTKCLQTKNNSDFSFTYLLVFLCSAPIILFVFCFSKYIILFTFGVEYQQLNELLPYMFITALFSVYGFLNNRHIGSLDGGGIYINKKTLIIALLGLVLTGVLIFKYGLKGAVGSIFIIEFVSFTIGNYFKKDAKIFYIHLSIFSVKNVNKVIFKGRK